MANQVISALFAAKEEISKALASASRASEGLEDDLSHLNQQFSSVQSQTDLSEEKLNDFKQEAAQLSRVTNQTSKEMSELSQEVAELDNIMDLSEDEVDDLIGSFTTAAGAADRTDQQIEQLVDEFNALVATADLSEGRMNQLRNAMIPLIMASAQTSREIKGVTNSLGVESAVAQAAKKSTDSAARSIDGLGEDALDTAADVGILAAVVGATSLEFSSLSVNIGPFNVALKNIIVQLPAIITGMGSLLAVVISLTSAFAVLGGTMAGLLAGGALAFFEDFSGQFEDSAAAAEALMKALRNLFIDAMRPLMTDANMDLFIDAINLAARVVNRFAQFFNQMREEVLGFLGQIGGDMEKFFEALHDSFVLLQPVLADFINFFLDGFPDVLMMFSRVTVSMANNVSGLIDAFGRLFTNLIEFAQVILGAVAPVIAAIVVLLADFFAILNSVNDRVLVLAIQVLALLAVFARIQSIIAGVTGFFATLSTTMLAQATAGSSLARMYIELTGIMSSFATGQVGIRVALGQATTAIKTHTFAMLSNAKAAIFENAVLQNLATTLAGMVGVEWANVTALTAMSWALKNLIPIIGVVLVAIGALIAIMQNWDAFTKLVSDSVAFISDSLRFLGGVIASIVIPPMNLLLAVLNLLMSPFVALAEGIGVFASEMLGLTGVSTEGTSALGMLADVIFFVLDALGFGANVLALVIKAISSLIGSGIVGFFQLLADVITAPMDLVIGAIDIVTGAIDGLMGVLQPLIDLFFKFHPAGIFIKAIADAFSGAEDSALSLKSVLSAITDILNTIPGVDIEGPDLSASAAREQLRREQQEQPTDDIQTKANVNLSFEDKLEQQVNVQADPEDKEGLRRIVKDAMNEANSISRRQEGVGR